MRRVLDRRPALDPRGLRRPQGPDERAAHRQRGRDERRDHRAREPRALGARGIPRRRVAAAGAGGHPERGVTAPAARRAGSIPPARAGLRPNALPTTQMLDMRRVCVAYYARVPSIPLNPKHRTETMSSYVKLAADAGDQYLTALAEFQENFLKSAPPARSSSRLRRPPRPRRPARVRAADSDGSGSHRSEFRVRAEAPEDAEDVRREAARRPLRPRPANRSSSSRRSRLAPAAVPVARSGD